MQIAYCVELLVPWTDSNESWLVELVSSISLQLTVSQYLAYNLIAELMRSSAVWES